MSAAKPYALYEADIWWLGEPVMNQVHGDVLSRRQRHILLTDEQFADYTRVMAEFEAWQERLVDADGHTRAGDPYLLP